MTEHQPAQNPLTFAGRVVVLGAIVVGGGIFYAMLLPEGTSPQPLVFVMILVVMGAAAFFVAASGILHLMGIRVWRDSKTGDRTEE